MAFVPATSERQSCPSDESLLAYLLATSPVLTGRGAGHSSPAVGSAGDAAFAAHVAACDRCVAELRIARARLCLAAEVDAPVPAAVLARAAGRPAATSLRRFAARAWLRRVQESFRLPVLVPVAATLAVVVVATIPDRGSVPVAEESTRSVALRQKARVTAPTATLHVSPDASAHAAAEIDQGTAVFLLAESGGWYHVELENGTPGWMETSAFE